MKSTAILATIAPLAAAFAPIGRPSTAATAPRRTTSLQVAKIEFIRGVEEKTVPTLSSPAPATGAVEPPRSTSPVPMSLMPASRETLLECSSCKSFTRYRNLGRVLSLVGPPQLLLLMARYHNICRRLASEKMRAFLGTETAVIPMGSQERAPFCSSTIRTSLYFCAHRSLTS